jgi:hypothetical protein
MQLQTNKNAQEAIHHVDGLAHEALVIRPLLRIHAGRGVEICGSALASLVVLQAFFSESASPIWVGTVTVQAIEGFGLES